MRTHIWMALLAVLIGLPLWWFTAGANVDPAVAIPQFSHQSGYYEQAITLSVRSPARRAAVLLTTDGRTPTTADRLTEPLVLSGQQVAAVKSRLLWPDGLLGPVVAQTYFVNLQTALPVLNLTVEPDDLWDETVGIYVNTAGRGADWERPGTAVFFDPIAQNGWVETIGLRLHGGGSRAFEKKSLRLYFRDERLVYPLFGEVGAMEFRQLVVHSGGQDLGEFALSWTLLRDQLASELAQEMGLYSPRSRPVLLFINGQPWGIYLLRDRPNERFLRDQYG
ncbi:MAG: CotH kinase family protein, partial [Anaerolineales bacterium]|nr:CotH kinase family protein [Anaerolineales bacterium]